MSRYAICFSWFNSEYIAKEQTEYSGFYVPRYWIRTVIGLSRGKISCSIHGICLVPDYCFIICFIWLILEKNVDGTDHLAPG